jgi:lysozyme
MAPENRRRTAIAGLVLSAAGLVAIVGQEGYSSKATIPVAGDVPTIGFGTTAGVRLGDTTTPQRALGRALRDIGTFEGALKQCVHVPLAQGEYDAFVGLAYNIGGKAFCNSRLVQKVNAGDYKGACGEILRWTYYQGKDCADARYKHLCGGLATRRQQEYKQCMEG